MNAQSPLKSLDFPQRPRGGILVVPMKLELTSAGVARATLSRRNVATLLHHLEAAGPRRWVESNDVLEDGGASWERLFVARCHEDDEAAANGLHGSAVAWSEGASVVVDCSRSLLTALLALAEEAEPEPIRAGQLELRAEGDERHYLGRMVAPGRVEEATEQHLLAAYGRAVREPVRLGPVATILFDPA